LETQRRFAPIPDPIPPIGFPAESAIAFNGIPTFCKYIIELAQDISGLFRGKPQESSRGINELFSPPGKAHDACLGMAAWPQQDVTDLVGYNMPENDPLRGFESARDRAVESHVEHARIEDVRGPADPAFVGWERVAEGVSCQPRVLAHRLRQNADHKISRTQGSLAGKIRWELLQRGWTVEPTNLNAKLSEDPSCPVLRLAKNMRVYLCVIVNPQSQGPGSVGC